MKLLNIFIIPSISLSAFAELPHKFSPGTPAKASEVNENFQYLNDQIDELKNNASESGSYTCETNTSDYPYTYTHEVSPLGTSMFLGDSEYKLVKFAVIDDVSGDEYHVTMPTLVYSQTSPTTVDYVRFSPAVNNQYGGYRCTGSSAFGTQFVYNIATGFTVGESINYSNDGDDDTGTYYDTYKSQSLRFYATIAVGSRYMQVSYVMPSHSTEKLVSSGDYDFTDDIVDVNPDFTDDIAELTTFLNHIYVQKVSE